MTKIKAVMRSHNGIDSFQDVKTKNKTDIVVLVGVSMLWCLTGMTSAQDSNSKVSEHQIVDEIKRALLKQINLDRRRHGLKPVLFDSLASKVGDRHCRESLLSGYQGHFGLNGSKPYHRYAQMGGYDAIAENFSAAWWAGYDVNLNFLLEKALQLHEAMYSERPPADGHRRNILAPQHNYCGIGVAFNRDGLRITEEFIDRYVSVYNLPKTSLQLAQALSDTLWITGRTLKDARVASVTIFYEPQPKPMTAQDINRTHSYGLPDERKDLFEVLSGGYLYTDGKAGDLILDESRTRFKVPVLFWKRKKGIYTVVIWVYLTNRHKSFPATNICFFVQ